MAVQLARYRFTVDDYQRMGEAGILGEDDRVELIDGEVLKMSPIGHRHVSSVFRLNRAFQRLGERAIVSIQSPIRLDDHAEPQPDATLLRPRPDIYRDGIPTANDVLLVVEVADSSVEYDRQVKAPLYAHSGIPEYWLVDLQRDHIVVSCDPTADGYATPRVFRRGETIAPLAFPDLVVAVDDILG
jgi:Uma2 family endonuclease